MKSDYEIIADLGQGSFGSVYKVKRKGNAHTATSHICVMKIIPISQLDPTSQEDSLNEVKILSSLDNPYIVKYLDSFVEHDKLFIIMEYCEKGDISKFLKSRQQALKEPKIWEIFLQICLGLEYLHSKKVLHRDIKTMNIFLYNDKIIRIGDLGVAKVLSSTATFAHTVIGTPYYLSPELCEEKPYNVKSDVWAAGCVLHELCSLKRPFEASNAGALILKILRSSYPPISTTYSNELREIVRLCLLKDHKKRPEISAILRRPGIKDKIVAAGLVIPETSVLYSKPQIPKGIDEAEEEQKSVASNKAKFSKSQDSKAQVQGFKPRVRKGAPLYSKRTTYAKPSYAVKLPKAIEKPVTKEKSEISSEFQAKPFVSSIEEDEPSINEDVSYDIITSEAPPLPQLTINTVQTFAINKNLEESGSSDDESYHSDDKELYNIKEVDEKLEHTDKMLKFKLQEITRSELEYERAIDQRRNEIINQIGFKSFEELYKYYREKYSSEVEMNEEEQESVQQFIIKLIGDPNSEALYGMCRLIILENELMNCKDAAADIKFRLL